MNTKENTPTGPQAQEAGDAAAKLADCMESWLGAIDMHPELSGARKTIELAASYIRTTTTDWFCEQHPDKVMGHDGCEGAGIYAEARIPLLLNSIRLHEQRNRELIAQYEPMARALFDKATPPARVVSDEMVGQYRRIYMQNYVDGRVLSVPERIKRALEAALSTLQSGAEGKDGLPELPEPEWFETDGDSYAYYDADQMRAYANGHAAYWQEMHRAANKRAEGLAELAMEYRDECVTEARLLRLQFDSMGGDNSAWSGPLGTYTGRRIILDELESKASSVSERYTALQPGQGTKNG